ncbi:MAG: hypothetical protein WAW00_03825 [Candidatus Moraniibacteriota bacterium]
MAPLLLTAPAPLPATVAILIMRPVSVLVDLHKRTVATGAW